MLQSPGWSTEIKLTSYACLYLPANAQPSFSDIENATTTITPCHRDGAICNCYAALHSREVGHGVYPTLFLGGSHLLHNPTSHVSLVNPTSHVSSVSTASGFDLQKSLGMCFSMRRTNLDPYFSHMGTVSQTSPRFHLFRGAEFRYEISEHTLPSSYLHPGHAWESYTSQALVLARDSRVPWRKVRLDGRSSRQPNCSNGCGRATTGFSDQGAQRVGGCHVGKDTSPPRGASITQD